MRPNLMPFRNFAEYCHRRSTCRVTPELSLQHDLCKGMFVDYSLECDLRGYIRSEKSFKIREIIEVYVNAAYTLQSKTKRSSIIYFTSIYHQVVIQLLLLALVLQEWGVFLLILKKNQLNHLRRPPNYQAH